MSGTYAKKEGSQGQTYFLLCQTLSLLKADAKFKMSEITPNVKVARCKTP